MPRSAKEKAEQRALLQYYLPENRKTVMDALRRAGRSDLIGNGPNCLIKGDNNPTVNNKKTPQKKRRYKK